MIKVRFWYKIDHEISKLIYTLSRIQNGFYGSKNFYLTHTITNQDNTIVVPNITILPNILKNSELSNVPNAIPKNNPYLKKLRPKILSHFTTPEIDVSSYEENWKKIDHKFNEIIDKLFAVTDFNVDVYLTSTGSISTFYFERNSKDITIFLRTDGTNGNIAYAIISSLLSLQYNFNENNPNNIFTWNQLQYMIKTILETPMLRSLLDFDFEPVDTMRLPSTKIITNSNRIYNWLGYKQELPFEINTTVFYKNEIIRNLSKNEHILLAKFLENKNEVLSYDEIANIIWGENFQEHFSLQAITKVIQRIRQGLQKNGLDKNIIFNERDKGYILIA